MLTIGMSEPVFMEKHSFDWILMVTVIGCARALTASMGSKQGAERDLDMRSQTGILRSSPV
jgi:hypothetical protein